MTRICYITCILFCFMIFNAAAQPFHQIKGSIIDKTTREPLEFVNVSVTGLDKATVTDDKGIFVFDNIPPGIYTLKATAIDCCLSKYFYMRDKSSYKNFFI